MTSAEDSRRRDVRALAAVLVGALTLRLVYVAEYVQALPFIDGPVGDSVVYLEQAFHIGRGEFGDPTLLAMSPLYGYFLFLFGAPDDLVTPIGIQILLGLGSAALIFVAARARFGLGAAVVSGMLFSTYGAILFLESKILSDSLGLILIVAVQALYLSARFRRGELAVAVFCGLLAGAAILARASLVFCAPLLVLAAALPWTKRSPFDAKIRLRRAGLLALGLGAVLLANGLWNQHNSGLFVPIVLVSDTLERASGDGARSGSIHDLSPGLVATPYDVVTQARDRLARERAGEQTSAPSVDLGAWFSNLPERLPGTFSNRERTFQYGYLGERSRVTTLDVLPICFGLLLLWGIVGAIRVVRDDGMVALAPFLPLFLGAVACTTLYHPSTRYRLAMVVPLILLAGTAMVRFVRRPETTRDKLVLGALLALSLGVVGHHYSLELKNHAAWEIQLANSAAVAGHDDEALRHIDAAVAHAPNDQRLQAQAQAMRQALHQRRQN